MSGMKQGGEAPACVITHLAMEVAPTRPFHPPPLGAPIALMRVEAPSVHLFLYLYQTVGADYNWTDMLALAPEQLRAFVCDPKVELFVLYRGGAPAGFFQLDFRDPSACELTFFGLMPEAIGHGLGPWLLDEALREAWAPTRSPATQRLTVHTCTDDHPKALPLYQRAGFVPVRRETRAR
ncbi:MAG: GNAT family N-acetyltransferase [Neomegalonema sp.]|nr:GNAT family N-acetyltransferase [Neomegalonema sp.]